MNDIFELIKQYCHAMYHEKDAPQDIGMTIKHKILHEHLTVAKICTRWFACTLTVAQNKVCDARDKKILKTYKRGPIKTVYNNCTGSSYCVFCMNPVVNRKQFFQKILNVTKVIHARSKCSSLQSKRSSIFGLDKRACCYNTSR